MKLESTKADRGYARKRTFAYKGEAGSKFLRILLTYYVDGLYVSRS